MSAPLLLIPAVAFLAASIPRAAAQGTSAVCESGYAWMNNSKGQSPCLVSSYLFTPCSAPADSWVYPLDPGYHYNTPLDNSQSATPCRCNTVLFSMISACATCQGQGDYIVPWDTYSQNCTDDTTPKSFQIYPENIPVDTAIPSWAYLDVVASNTFNATAALAVEEEGAPDSTASAAASSTSATSSSTSNFPSTPTSTASSAGSPQSGNDSSSSGGSSSKSNVGAIVGGVVGGVVGAIAIGAAIFFFMRHRRNQIVGQVPTGPLDLTAGGNYTQYAQYPDREKTPAHDPTIQPLVSSPRLYDPNDPSTFPSGEHYAGSADQSGYPATETTLAGAYGQTTAGYTPSMATNQNRTYKGAPEL